MKYRILQALIICMAVVAIVFASCSPATTTPTVAQTTVQSTVTPTTNPARPTTVTPTTVTPTTVTPKYGGTITIGVPTDQLSFDSVFPWASSQPAQGYWSVHLTNEKPFQGDWARGPAGTGEVSWLIYSFDNTPRWAKSGLVESWEFDTDAFTLTFHIRQGVYWHNKSPVNGRELTAADVVFSTNRTFTTPTSTIGLTYPHPTSITATDKYTVVMKFASVKDLTQDIKQIGDQNVIWPSEAVVKFGDMRDWRNSIGTGPFILTDYVKGSSLTLERNPNYWDVDPIGPGKGNKLPYLDGVRILIMPDVSTKVAAIRTGKIDRADYSFEDTQSLKKTNSALMSTKFPYAPACIYMRQDNPEFPWSNLKVRQAMTMAINYQSIVDNYYSGEAEWYVIPVLNIPEYKPLFTPFKELPQSVQDLYMYQPDKAKKILTDAGYAKGFDMEIVCKPEQVDLLSIYKADWAKIGVNLIIDVRDVAVVNTTSKARTFKNASTGSCYATVPGNFDLYRSSSSNNGSFVKDDKVEAAHAAIWTEYMDWNPRQCQIEKEITPYILENCWYIQLPAYYQYVLWQPWIKNYHGEIGPGSSSAFLFPKWVWCDQDLKQQMIGVR